MFFHAALFFGEPKTLVCTSFSDPLVSFGGFHLQNVTAEEPEVLWGSVTGSSSSLKEDFLCISAL